MAKNKLSLENAINRYPHLNEQLKRNLTDYYNPLEELTSLVVNLNATARRGKLNQSYAKKHTNY